MINDKNTSNTEFIESVEDKLISIFLNNNNSAEKGVAYLEPKDFFKQENSAIFSVIKDLIGKTKTIDDLTVLSYFDANKNFQFLDYKTYINKLISLAPSTMALEEYIDIVKKASIKRGLDKVCGEIIKSNFNFVNFDKEIEKDVKEFNEIVWSKKTNDMQDIRSILNIALKLTEKHNDLVETGFETIDKILNGGFEKGEVTLLAAAPSVGKSTFAINVFSNECEKLAYTPWNNKEKPPMVLYISLEMSENQIIERLISMKALRSFKFNDYNNKRYSQSDMELFNYAIAEIEKYPCMINANFVASINDVRNQIAQLSNSYSVQFLVIDHLHIMSYDQNHENQEIANITKNLKAIAKQYNLSVLLLSQVNKNASTFGFNSKESIKKTDVEKDENEHQIHMNDIRGSGAPVQDAAIVMLMWQKSKPEGGDATVTINIAKNRSGANGMVDLKLWGSKYKFVEFSKREN